MYALPSSDCQEEIDEKKRIRRIASLVLFANVDVYTVIYTHTERER